jgi:ubiquinone/menaquinone biosynthesis C-methylase UbiE
MTSSSLRFISLPHQASPSRYVSEQVAIATLGAYLTERHKSILDVGCGNAEYRFVFDHRSYVGLDIVDRGFASKQSKNVSFVVGSAMKLPFEEESFDFVYCNFAFEYFPGPTEALCEMNRVLRTGGGAWLCIPTWWVSIYEWPVVLLRLVGLFRELQLSGQPDEEFYTPKDMRALVEAAGMQLIQIYPTSGPCIFLFKLFYLWYRFLIYVLFAFPIWLGSTGFRVVRTLQSPTCWGDGATNPNKIGTPMRPPRRLLETLWLMLRMGGMTAKVARRLRGLQRILPYRPTKAARDLEDLCRIQRAEMARIGIGGRIYAAIVRLCWNIDQWLFPTFGLEYAYLIEKPEKS